MHWDGGGFIKQKECGWSLLHIWTGAELLQFTFLYSLETCLVLKPSWAWERSTGLGDLALKLLKSYPLLQGTMGADPMALCRDRHGRDPSAPCPLTPCPSVLARALGMLTHLAFLPLLFSAWLIHLLTKHLLNTCCVPSMPGTKKRNINNRLFIPGRSLWVGNTQVNWSQWVVLVNQDSGPLPPPLRALFPPSFWSSRTDDSLCGPSPVVGSVLTILGESGGWIWALAGNNLKKDAINLWISSCYFLAVWFGPSDFISLFLDVLWSMTSPKGLFWGLKVEERVCLQLPLTSFSQLSLSISWH